jgi:hypothetical protein
MSTIRDLLDTLYVNTELQIGVSGSNGVMAWVLGINWLALLSFVLVIGQIGLLVPKYWKVYLEWKAKRGVEK